MNSLANAEPYYSGKKFSQSLNEQTLGETSWYRKTIYIITWFSNVTVYKQTGKLINQPVHSIPINRQQCDMS